MNKAELTKIVAELITLGENADELNFWVDIYEDIEPEQQVELATNLTQELADLKASLAKPAAPQTAPETHQTPSSAAQAQE